MPIVIANPASPAPTGWDLASASYEKSFDVSSQTTGPAGFAFSPDGTRMYVTGFSGNAVYQYSLSSAWDIDVSNPTSFVQSKSVGTGAWKEVLFRPDGLKMYVVDTNLDDIHQWTLGTAWDISTATDDSVPFSFNSEDTNPNGVTFSSDGTKLYMVGLDNDTVYQYSLPAWDITTMSVDGGVTKSISGEEINPTGITFKTDGTVMYITGFTNKVYQYPLSGAWDLSTAGTTTANVSVSTPPETQTRGVLFKSDGTKMYTVGSSADSVHQFGSL